MPDHNEVVNQAYGEGRVAAETGKAVTENPYYRGIEEWDAWRSGWTDRTFQLHRLTDER
jgi:hypothetical protein